MAEQFANNAKMQIEHQQWKQEHDAWRSDLVLWQDEHDAMRAALESLGRTIQRHGEALRSHAKSIDDHEAALDLHERDILGREIGHHRKGNDVPDPGAHQRQAIAHFDQRQVHEQMKREHHRLVGQLEMLDAILSE